MTAIHYAPESIHAGTRFCAVFGCPIRHSASPAMQNAGIEALGLDWRYAAFEVRPEELPGAIAGAKAMRFIGLNLTVPHKLLAMQLVDIVEEKARHWGAVNTIVFETRTASGVWTPVGQVAADQVTDVRSHGYNTDADAIIQSLREEFKWQDLRGASVLLLGAGGAARTAALRLAEEGVGVLHIVNRTPEKATRLLEVIAAQFPSVKPSHELPSQRVDLLLNATSLGLKADDAPPISGDWLRAHRPARVYDMIYRPAETALLKAARNAGCQTANGLGMLLYQGAKALELWSGRPAPAALMRDALEKNVYGGA